VSGCRDSVEIWCRSVEPGLNINALRRIWTRTPRAHVTVAAAVAAGDDAASAAAEEADDAERPTPPMLPLMPRGMDADAAMPMPGPGGSSEEREPGAAVCAPAPNFELLCVVYCMASM